MQLSQVNPPYILTDIESNGSYNSNSPANMILEGPQESSKKEKRDGRERGRKEKEL